MIVAEPHALVRDGLKLIVGSVLGGACFADAHDADSLLRALRRYPEIRLALLDVRMPGMEAGLRLLELAREHPQVALVVMSATASAELVQRILKVRTVRAFVPKSADSHVMSTAIRKAMQGVMSPAIHGSRSGVRQVPLTPRQEEICRLLRQGYSNKMIAGALGITTGTVKNHLTEIFKALNATNRTQAAQLNTDAQGT